MRSLIEKCMGRIGKEMKILWLTNYPLPQIAIKVGLPVSVNEGGLIEVAEKLAL